MSPKCKTPNELFGGPKSLDHWRQTNWNSNEEWTRSDGLIARLDLISGTVTQQLKDFDKKSPLATANQLSEKELTT